MTFELPVVVALASGVLSAVDPIPYIRDTLRGTTRPQRSTRFVWSVLGVVAVSSQLADGATWSITCVAVQTAGIIVTFGLSIRRGVGGRGPGDLAAMAIAAMALAAWSMTSDPTWGTGLIIVADVVGFGAMVPKTWSDPWSETLSTYAIAASAGICGVVAVGSGDAALLLYPAYLAISCAAFAVLIVVRRNARPAVAAAATA